MKNEKKIKPTTEQLEKKLKSYRFFMIYLIFIIALLSMMLFAMFTQTKNIQEEERVILNNFQWCVTNWQNALTNYIQCQCGNSAYQSPFIYPSNPPKYPNENETYLIP